MCVLGPWHTYPETNYCLVAMTAHAESIYFLRISAFTRNIAGVCKDPNRPLIFFLSRPVTHIRMIEVYIQILIWGFLKNGTEISTGNMIGCKRTFSMQGKTIRTCSNVDRCELFYQTGAVHSFMIPRPVHGEAPLPWRHRSKGLHIRSTTHK